MDTARPSRTRSYGVLLGRVAQPLHMPRPLSALTAETTEALYFSAVLEQKTYRGRAMERSFRRRLQEITAKQARTPRIQDGRQSLTPQAAQRPEELPHLTAAIMAAVDRGERLYAICRFCEVNILPHLITEMPRTTRALLDRIRQKK
jgi:hypothetical protein